MLDIKFVRSNPELVKAGARKKRIEVDIDSLLALDSEARALVPVIDEMRARQKGAGKELSSIQGEQRERALEAQRASKQELKLLEEQKDVLDREIKARLLRVPMPPAEAVPEGRDDSENVEIKRWGQARTFDFEPLDHVALAEAQGWIDFERGARIAGSRNYVLRGDLSLLEGALMRWALEHMVQKGFEPLSVPVLVRSETMVGTGYFPGGEDQAYRCDARDDLVLAGTAEVPVTSFHAGEILPLAELPKRFVALSSCYRREAGTYGKDTRGLYRVHQFQKVEQVIIDVADAARSLEHHLMILRNSEELLEEFQLPYRVVNVCGGDLGAGQVQKFDIETWMPSRKGYGETHSASRFHDYQARRLDMRYRDAEGKVQVCHTLNNTVAASARLLLAMLENHQARDGRVWLPPALRPYLGGREWLGKPLRPA